jgi:transcriptional regulator with XRE-family HTH domain
MAEQTFADRLRQLRQDAGLTIKVLAEKAGMHHEGVAQLERGRRKPTWDTVQALAKALGVDCTAFQTDAGQADPPPAPKGRKRK